MKSSNEIGLKITAATREFYRYTGISARVEQRGMGSSRPELAWAKRIRNQEKERDELTDRNNAKMR